jgi:uncharacterized protein
MSRTAVFLRRLIVLLLFGLGLFLCKDLRLSDEAFDLLPGEAVRGDLRLLQQMGLVDRVFISLSVKPEVSSSLSDNRDILRESTRKLGELLEKSGHFSYVLSHLEEGYEFALFTGLQPSLPLLFDNHDLKTIGDLISREGIEEGLDKSFALLNSPAGIAMKKQVQSDPLGFLSVALQKLSYMQSEFSLQINQGFFMSEDGTSSLLVAESNTSLTDPNQAGVVENSINQALQEALAPGVEARLIGSLPHTLANSRVIKNDLRILLPAATLLLILLLGFTLRNIRALAVVSVPYMAAPLAIGLTALVHGKLGGLALGFGIVLLGIAVDFSIHLYVALTREPGTQREALKKVSRPLLYALLTTSSVFIVLLFSQVPSHQQMALLALFGILSASLCSWLVIPTITSFSGKNVGQSLNNRWPTGFSPKRPGRIILIWLFLLAAGVLAWPQLQYNGDLQALDVPDKKIAEDERQFAATWGEGGEQAFVIVTGDTLDEVLDRNQRVFRFLIEEGAGSFQSFSPLLPGPAAQQENLLQWQRFWEEHRIQFEQQFTTAAHARGFKENAFAPFFSWLDSEPEQISPEAFLGGPLQPLFSSMLKVPDTTPPQEDTYLAMTTAAIDDQLLARLQDFAKEDGINILATKKWRSEVEEQLRHDVVNLSLAAAMIITLLVILQFRNGAAVVAVLAPVSSALAAMSIFCFLTGRELNMMHLIMGIMVIGLSVDYGIFTVCAKISGLQTSSSRAVSICAASSLIGFGVLTFAGHPALHALGVTVLVGIGVAWPTAILVSPALLAFAQRKH